MDSLPDLNGTRWTGTAERWLDPLGDTVSRSNCSISVETDVVQYAWVILDEQVLSQSYPAASSVRSR